VLDLGLGTWDLDEMRVLGYVQVLWSGASSHVEDNRGTARGCSCQTTQSRLLPLE
jgi:hypothetical protein